MTSAGFMIASFHSLVSSVRVWVSVSKSTEVDRFTFSDNMSHAAFTSETWMLTFSRWNGLKVAENYSLIRVCGVFSLQLWFTIAVLEYVTKLWP